MQRAVAHQPPDKIAAQIITDVGVAVIAAPVAVKILNTLAAFGTAQVFAMQRGTVRTAPVEPAVFILMKTRGITA